MEIHLSFLQKVLTRLSSDLIKLAKSVPFTHCTEHIKLKKHYSQKADFSLSRLQSSAEHVRICFLTPYCRSMLSNLQGSGGQVWTETASRKPATTNAGEHLLSVRHTKLSPRSPSPPSGAWETAQSQGQPPNAEWTQRQFLSVEGELPNCSLKYSYLHTVPTPC